MNYKLFSFLVLSIFLLSTASAMTVYADYSDGTQSKTINVGDSITFNADFFSMNPPMSMDAGIYSGDTLYYSFLDSSTSGKTYYNTYTYVATLAGTYEIRVIGTDKINTDSEFLTLTVNFIPPVNHAPVITSVPISQVNEGTSYSYDVQATDSDGDTLTYSLTEHPSWLSINPTTGVISGVAQLVSTDTNFDVEVEVSDGHGGIDTQSYTLKVKNICDGDTTPPVITVLGSNPVTVIQGNTYTDAGATAWDNVDGDITSHIITVNPVNTNVIGTYTVTYNVQDAAGNHAVQKTRTVHVVACPPVNHAPVITSVPISQVNEGSAYTYDVQATDSDGDTLTYSLTEHPSWLSINPTTGLISGIAPSVSSDTNYNVEVEVSDGNGGIDTQSYTLKVKDICGGDTTPPVITVVSPENREYDTHTISVRVYTDEPAEVRFRLDEGTIIEMNNPSDNLFTYSLHVDNDGSHIITLYAEDSSGNVGREYARFSIETEEHDDENGDGGNEMRTISDIYYENKYFDQFSLDKVNSTATDATTAKSYTVSGLILFYILIGLICLGIIILVFLLVRNLRR